MKIPKGNRHACRIFEEFTFNYIIISLKSVSLGRIGHKRRIRVIGVSTKRKENEITRYFFSFYYIVDAALVAKNNNDDNIYT